MTAFIDSNVFVYALGDDAKGETARWIIEGGGRISVQCLNEFVSVARGKLKRDWADVETALAEMRARHGPVIDMTLPLHIEGIRIAQRYSLSIYDSMMIAAAVSVECDIFYSEDMHHGLTVDGRMRIVNPFVSA